MMGMNMVSASRYVKPLAVLEQAQRVIIFSLFPEPQLLDFKVEKNR